MNCAVLLRASVALALLTGAMSTPAATDPTDPAAPAAADRYRSPFADYRAYQPPVRPPWHDVLQEVVPRSGSDESHEGHAGHAGHGGHAQPEGHDDHQKHQGQLRSEPPAPAPADHSQHKHQ